MTYSIVARDAHTGEIGVAVQTAMFAVGAVVPWARAGVGAVATQGIAEAGYGPRCLERMATGASAAEALESARAADGLAALRQVGAVDASGAAAAFTGDLCIDECGHLVGDGWSVQANMMASASVWPAMAAAFEDAATARLPFARRLLAALRGAEDAGGDARGAMSAALTVVDGERAEEPWAGRRIDLRVDRHDRPVEELGRLLDAADAFRTFDRGVEALLAGDGPAALVALDTGLTILPGEPNLRFPRAGALLLVGRPDEATAELESLISERPSWRIVIEGFTAKGLLTLPDGDT